MLWSKIFQSAIIMKSYFSFYFEVHRSFKQPMLFTIGKEYSRLPRDLFGSVEAIKDALATIRRLMGIQT